MTGGRGRSHKPPNDTAPSPRKGRHQDTCPTRQWPGSLTALGTAQPWLPAPASHAAPAAGVHPSRVQGPGLKRASQTIPADVPTSQIAATRPGSELSSSGRLGTLGGGSQTWQGDAGSPAQPLCPATILTLLRFGTSLEEPPQNKNWPLESSSCAEGAQKGHARSRAPNTQDQPQSQIQQLRSPSLVQLARVPGSSRHRTKP